MTFHAWGPNERRVVWLSSVTLRQAPGCWDYALREADAIEAHWQRRKATHPRMFNGVVQLLAGARLVDGHLEGRLVTTDFKSFLHWKDHGYPDDSVRDAFGSALLVSGDDRVLLGRQGAGQLNSGLAYLPGGFIDARDVAADGSVAIADSTARELFEETGLGAGDVVCLPGAVLTLCGAMASIAIVFRSELDSGRLATRIRSHIQADPDPELEDVLMVGRGADLDGVALADYAEVLMGALFPGRGQGVTLALGGATADGLVTPRLERRHE